MMEAARTSETFVNLYQTTQRCNPEDSLFTLAAVRTSDTRVVFHLVLDATFQAHSLQEFGVF
jgi:hypothetical protein